MATDASQEIRAELIAAYVEVDAHLAEWRSRGMVEADVAFLKDHLDAIGRMVEEALSAHRADDTSDYARGSEAPSASYPASSRSPAERPSTL